MWTRLNRRYLTLTLVRVGGGSSAPGTVVVVLLTHPAVRSFRVVLTQTHQGLLQVLSRARYALARVSVTFTPGKREKVQNIVTEFRTVLYKGRFTPYVCVCRLGLPSGPILHANANISSENYHFKSKVSSKLQTGVSTKVAKIVASWSLFSGYNGHQQNVYFFPMFFSNDFSSDDAYSYNSSPRISKIL